MGLRRSMATTAVAATAVAASAAALRVAGPPAAEFIANAVPRVHATLLAWLEPPYLYFVVNVIILSIAASSRLYSGSESRTELSDATPGVSVAAAGAGSPLAVLSESERPVAEEKEEDFVLARSVWSPAVAKGEVFPSPSSSVEKPLLSARFVRRRSPRPSLEGRWRALGVARQRREETLEGTWRAITEGRPVPLSRHLKKSDTWESQRRNEAEGEAEAPEMRKAETFRDGGRLRREASLGQDELNRRVEAFIEKFNEEMRLQRQQSFQQYIDMVGGREHIAQ